MNELQRVTAALADRYRVEREAGRGGMATVYLAEDLKHRRKVAIKVLKPELAAIVGQERFLREIEIIAGLSHPHVLPLHDSGVADGRLYYVMPFVEGESLRGRLMREHQLPLQDALQVAREVADALSYAHAHGVVHRDIKPENILFQSAHAVVTDFGIARGIESDGPLTGTGIAVGTPAYMSPEQATGVDRVDGRSDIYSLAVVLYEMLVGEPPFTGPNVQAILARKSMGEVRQLATVRESVPAGVEAAVITALARNPADRYPTARAFSDALEGGSPFTSSGGATPARRRFRVPALALAAVVVLTGILTLTGNLPFVVRPAAASFFHERDPVVVADFANQTDQPALGLAIRDAFVTDFDQSPYAVVVDRAAMRAVLERMRLPDTSVVDGDIAVELARREGYPAVIAGGVTPFGSGYQITARVIEASTGDVAVRLRETASGGDDVIDAVERLVRLARRHLGESLGSVRRSAPLPSVTTASLEALELAARGRDLADRGRPGEAIPLYERAIALDTAFAAGYRALGILLGNIGRPLEAQRYQDLAFQHAERLNVRERLLITAAFHAYRGRSDSAAEYYRRLLERDPRHRVALNNLGDAYERMGRYEESLDLYRRVVAVDSTVVGLLNMASAARTLGRHALADSAAAAMRRLHPNVWPTWRTESQNALYAGHDSVLVRMADEMRTTDWPFIRGWGHWVQTNLSAVRGHIGRALEQVGPALDLTAEAGARGWEYSVFRTAVWTAYAGGDVRRALSFRPKLREPAEMESAPWYRHRVSGDLATAHALAGQVDRAEVLLAQMDSLERAVGLRPSGGGNVARAVLALRAGQADSAMSFLRRARADRFGVLSPDARFLLAEALHALGRSAEAAAHFDSLSTSYRLNFDDLPFHWPLRPVAHERAGAAYLAAGDTVRAMMHLGAFIDLWEAADPELQPIVARAREQLTQLASR